MPPKKQQKKEVEEVQEGSAVEKAPSKERSKSRKKGPSKSSAETEEASKVVMDDKQLAEEPPKKIRKTADAEDCKEDAKKQTAKRKGKKTQSRKDSDGEDESDEDYYAEIANAAVDSDEESSGNEESEFGEAGGTKKSSGGKTSARENKKRTRDGKTKKVASKDEKKKGAKRESTTEEKPKNKDQKAVAQIGKDNKGKDEGKQMMSEKEAKAAIADYMKKQNRPYSLQNVIDNMHGRVKKTLCQKVLDDLTDEKVLTCKEYGKAKIYLANQDNFPTVSNEELAKLDAVIKEKKDQLSQYQGQLKEVQAQLKDISGGLSNEELIKEIERLKASNSEMAERVAVYEKGDVKMLSEEEVNQVKTDAVKYGNEWRKRKRGCMDIVGQICESADLNPKEFVKKLGFDTDEDYKLDINEVLANI